MASIQGKRLPGVLCVFVGVGGSGKTTAIRDLHNCLVDDVADDPRIWVHTTQQAFHSYTRELADEFKARTDLSEADRRAALARAFNNDRELHHRYLRPLLERPGNIVLCDRWTYCTTVYQRLPFQLQDIYEDWFFKPDLVLIPNHDPFETCGRIVERAKQEGEKDFSYPEPCPDALVNDDLRYGTVLNGCGVSYLRYDPERDQAVVSEMLRFAAAMSLLENPE